MTFSARSCTAIDIGNTKSTHLLPHNSKDFVVGMLDANVWARCRSRFGHAGDPM